ncbi:hypothetical protein CBS147347_11487 [Aspergillus niger]|nr:hypothetical protein CBS147347_11487 [Aspergillus niger]
MKEPHGMFTHSDYTVGWICALPESELVAAMAMLDERHPVLPAIDPHDSNSYVLGSIGDHNVVVACLPAETTGKVSAATVAKDMIRSFPAVRFGLMVGIGGGAPYFGAGGSDNRTEAKEGGDSEDSDESDDDPADTRDIRLGDVAISLHSKSSDAVVQYDFGKSLQEKRFILSGGKLNKPPSIVLSAVALLQAQHRMEGHQILNTLSNIMSTYPALATKFQHPGPQKDYLFKAEFIHETGKKTCKRCRSQDSNLVKRDHRPDNSPRLHYGTIGSADQVMKDALLRDKWAREEGIICFEMEAAGLMDSFPCLVIRGICDYADSHKNKIWQPYAAATAACYAKELLHVISGQGVMIMDPVKQIEKSVREVYSIVKDTSAAVQDLSMRSRQRKVLDKLLYVEGSSFDASDAEHEARCHPETRVDLLKQILEWADNQRGECIFWLNGMAGTGKSTISRTIAQRFREKKQLGASFFFKRGEDKRASARRLFTTICAQLLLQNPTLIRYVESTIDKDPHISGKSLQEQFTKLLLEPILSLDGGECTNIVILIDALDECDNKDDIRTILQLLPDVQKCKSRNIRIFITSRPELPIRPVFEQNSNHRCLALHNLSDTVVGEDIRNFMKDEFSLIKERRKILGQWPGDDVLETLVRRAVPLFISAFTMCRFVDDPNWLPEDRLLMLLENPAAISGSPMDRTYLPVLQQLLLGAIGHEKKQLEQEFQDTVGVIILLANPLSVYALAQLIGSDDHTIKLWDPATGVEQRTLTSHSDSVLSVAFSPDGRMLASGSYNHTLKLWDTATGIEQYTLIGHSHLVRSVAFSPDGYTLASGSWDNTIKLWDPATGIEQHILTGHSRSVNSVAFSPDGRILASGSSDHTIKLWDLATGIEQRTLKGHSDIVQSVAFSPDGYTLASGSNDNTIKLWNTVTGVKQYTLTGHSYPVGSVAFSLDGRMLASGSWDNTIKLWDPATGVKQCTLTGHSDSVWR